MGGSKTLKRSLECCQKRMVMNETFNGVFALPLNIYGLLVDKVDN